LSTNQQRLLIVDDQADLRELLQSYLSNEGFDVAAVEDGSSLDRHLAHHEVDLVILDLMLPGEDGLSIGRRLRQQKNLPIIILSARGEELDRIVGLEMGADDYLTKPFNPRELLARIRSVLRRCRDQAAEHPVPEKTIHRFGPYELDVDQYRLLKDGQAVSLTTGEFKLLRIFVENTNRVLSRDNLLEMTKGYDHSPMDRSIDVCVGRLRKKIEADPAHPVYLKTIRGAGYLFSVED
jgi:two-component system phosphate regulon response regulator OmpR